MDLQTAIERAYSSLEEQVFWLKSGIERTQKESGLRKTLESKLHLDTEALQTLREWKPEENI